MNSRRLALVVACVSVAVLTVVALFWPSDLIIEGATSVELPSAPRREGVAIPHMPEQVPELLAIPWSLAGATDGPAVTGAASRRFAVEGLVVDAEGKPVAGAEILVSRVPDRLRDRRRETSGTRGRFRLARVGSDSFLGARAAGHGPSPVVYLGGTSGGTVPLVLTLPSEHGTLRLQASDAEGHPLSGVSVTVGGPRGWPALVPVGQRVRDVFGPAPIRLTTDDAGAAESRSVPAGSTAVVLRAAGWGAWQGEVTVGLGEVHELAITLERAARLTGHVWRWVAGVRQSAADVLVVALPQGEWKRSLRAVVFEARSQADGHYTLDGLPPGPLELIARDRLGASAVFSLAVPPGEQRVQDIDLAAELAIRGQLLDDAGRTQVGWRVRAKPQGKGVRPLEAVTDGMGRFDLFGCSPLLYTLEISDALSGNSPPVLVRRDVSPSGSEVQLVTPHDPTQTASLLLAVHGEVGAALPGARVVVTHDGQRRERVARWLGGGSFELGPLAAGDMSLVVEAAGYLPQRIDDLELLNGELRDLGVVTLAVGGRLRVTFRGPPGHVDTFEPRVTLVDARGRHVEHLRRGVDAWDSSAQPPGSYHVQLHAKSQATRAVPVQIVAGEVADVTILPEQGWYHVIAMNLSDTQTAEASLWSMTLRDDLERLVFSAPMDLSERGGQQLVAATWLAAGDYVVTLTHPNEQAVVTSIRVTPSSLEDPGFTLVDLFDDR
jgi:hypothetical protein